MNSVLKAWADLPPIFADRLMALLGDEARIARGLHHVNALLLEADRLCDPHWLRPLRWAILYHDAIHEPLAPDGADQRASADLWAEHFSAIHETVRGVSCQWEHDVATAILATADPFDRSAALLPWQHALLDLDLGVLGADPALYEAARLHAAAAFAGAGGTAAQWAARRRDRVSRALACPTLFHRIHRDRDAAARHNLRQELALP